MSIPDAAIEAAAEALHDQFTGFPRNDARTALSAAMPAIREAFLQEASDVLPSEWYDVLAASIVRGGTP